jgi:hypothetical protein
MRNIIRGAINIHLSIHWSMSTYFIVFNTQVLNKPILIVRNKWRYTQEIRFFVSCIGRRLAIKSKYIHHIEMIIHKIPIMLTIFTRYIGSIYVAPRTVEIIASPKIIIVRSQSRSTNEGEIFIAASLCSGSIGAFRRLNINGRIRENRIATTQR